MNTTQAYLRAANEGENHAKEDEYYANLQEAMQANEYTVARRVWAYLGVVLTIAYPFTLYVLFWMKSELITCLLTK